MRGIARPCRRQLGAELHERWRAHLCGLCLTLRDRAGQQARILTGYDLLVLSVLVEAQSGELPTAVAGPCPLRGFRSATVVAAEAPAMTFAASAALLAGSAGLDDKVTDGDVPAIVRPIASRLSRRFAGHGQLLAERISLDPLPLRDATAAVRAVEESPGSSLADLLAPAGAAVSAMFAHCAEVAGRPENRQGLADAGDAFGRLVHLLDAVDDRGADHRGGRFNPLEAAGCDDGRALRVAQTLHADLLDSLARVDMTDGALAQALLGPAVAASIRRSFRHATNRDGEGVARPRAGTLRLAYGLGAVLTPAAWGGRGRRRRWEDDSYGSYGPPGGYGPRRRGCGGPSCGELLACDCCANCACDECCGGDSCCCCI